jgi:Zn-dependent M28 family amino/carboxypeptidase
MRNVWRLLLLVLLSKPGIAQTLPLHLIQADTLKHYVQALSNDSTLGRFTTSVGAHKAAQFIATQFAQVDLSTIHGNDGYMQAYLQRNGFAQVMGLNVMGAIDGNGKSDKFIIICAHYDHVGTHSQNASLNYGQKNDGYPSPKTASIYNGANDNASGVAAMLSLAKFFRNLPAFDYTILFVAFSGEEMGLLGSTALSQQLDPTRIKQVINLEMLGRARGSKPDQQLPFVTYGTNDAWVIDSLNHQYKRLSGSTSRTDFFLFDDFKMQNLYKRSDNYPFSELKIPANTIMMGTDKDKYYHHPDDEWPTLDYVLMEKVVRAIAMAITPFLYMPK